MIDNISNQPFSKKAPIDVHAQNRRAIDKIAKGMESQFAKLLLKQMQNSINKSNPESNATKIYQDMLHDEYAKIMTEQGQGLGLQKVIREQIQQQYNIPSSKPAHLPNKGISMKAQQHHIGKYHKESNHD